MERKEHHEVVVVRNAIRIDDIIRSRMQKSVIFRVFRNSQNRENSCFFDVFQLHPKKVKKVCFFVFGVHQKRTPKNGQFGHSKSIRTPHRGLGTPFWSKIVQKHTFLGVPKMVKKWPKNDQKWPFFNPPFGSKRLVAPLFLIIFRGTLQTTPLPPQNPKKGSKTGHFFPIKSPYIRTFHP